MADGQSRWERDAERVRKASPEWFDMNRWPWWLFAGIAGLFSMRGVYLLIYGHGWSRFWGLTVLLTLVPANVRCARRRRRGEPVLPAGPRNR